MMQTVKSAAVQKPQSAGRRRQGTLIQGAVLAGCLAFGTSAHAGLTFQFTYSTDPGATATTAAQQQAITTAGQLFSSMFATHFSNSATLQYNVVSQTSGVASASTGATLLTHARSLEVVQNKILTGIDANGATADGSIEINWGNNWVLDPNAPVDFANGELDVFSVIAHELTHSFGFASFAGLSGGTFRNKFDEFLTSLSGQQLIDGVSNGVDAGVYADASLNNALFTGANAIAANGGVGVSIQGQSGDPTAFSGALSHLGTNAFSAPIGGSPLDNALMLCCGGLNVKGQGRVYNAAEVGIMRDLGYTPNAVNDVPEPGTLALVLAALGGMAMRRRKA